MKWRRAASLSPELNQGKVTGHKLWPHLADCGRANKKYIFVSFKGSTSLTNSYKLIFYCQGWSNYVPILTKMTKSKLNFFFINSSFDWSTRLPAFK